jgi:predicted O-methyltransferase YrrM
MNLPFSANIYSDFINKSLGDLIPEDMRRAQAEHKTPSPENITCRFISFMAEILKPQRIIDIGCGIGISTFALHNGCPEAEIHAIDGNKQRVEVCKSFLGANPKIHIFNEYAADFLGRTEALYDLAFIDSIKKEYPLIWRDLEPRLSHNGRAIFDDVFLYGYIAEAEEKIPPKYKSGTAVLKEFVSEMTARHPSFIFPIGGGMLLVRR